jgi:hypothetical protein
MILRCPGGGTQRFNGLFDRDSISPRLRTCGGIDERCNALFEGS